MAGTTTTTTNGNTSTTTTTPDKPKKVKGSVDVNGDGKVNALDDLNGDGRANDADMTLRRDSLSMEVLGRDYKTASQIVGQDLELKKVFKDAIAGGWTKEQFIAATQNTKWYEAQGSEFARKGWLAKAAGGAEWEDQIIQASDVVQRTAAQMGAVLSPDQLKDYAEKYIMGGWGTQGRQGLMADSLAGFVDSSRGSAASTTRALRELARNNGVSLSEKWVNDVTQSIARGESTQVDYESWIRGEAAKRYPMYADKIQAGVSVRALASPYLSRMQDILEIPEESIDLDNPFISSALGNVNEKGEQTGMSYGEFETKLRNDPRWENTKNGKNTLMNTTNNFMKSMGFATDNYFARG